MISLFRKKSTATEVMKSCMLCTNSVETQKAITLQYNTADGLMMNTICESCARDLAKMYDIIMDMKYE